MSDRLLNATGLHVSQITGLHVAISALWKSHDLAGRTNGKVAASHVPRPPYPLAVLKGGLGIRLGCSKLLNVT